MRKLSSYFLGIIVLGCSAMANPPQTDSDIALAYYNALYDLRLDDVRHLVGDQFVFEDPSVEHQQGLPSRMDSLDDFLAYIQGALATVEQESIVVDSFSSNGRVVLYVEVAGAFPATDEDRSDTPFKTRGITVIHVQDGLVIRHTDYYDYGRISSNH